MKKLYATIVVLVVLLIVPGAASASLEVESEADLDGGQEVPAVVTTMTGEVEIEIEYGELEFELEVEDNTHDIFAAHIHCAPPGVNGPVGVTLFVGSFTADEGTVAEGTIAAPDAGNGCGWADLGDVAAANRGWQHLRQRPHDGGVRRNTIRGDQRKPARKRSRSGGRGGPRRQSGGAGGCYGHDRRSRGGDRGRSARVRARSRRQHPRHLRGAHPLRASGRQRSRRRHAVRGVVHGRRREPWPKGRSRPPMLETAAAGRI